MARFDYKRKDEFTISFLSFFWYAKNLNNYFLTGVQNCPLVRFFFLSSIVNIIEDKFYLFNEDTEFLKLLLFFNEYLFSF